MKDSVDPNRAGQTTDAGGAEDPAADPEQPATGQTTDAGGAEDPAASLEQAANCESQPESRTLLLVGGLAIFLLYTWHFTRWDLLVDDAFISFRYAENLASRGELVFNAGERVEGYSNFLWTAMLAGLAALGAPPQQAAPTLGYILGLATLVATYLTSRRLLHYVSVPSLLASGLLAVNVSWSFWAASGMESVLFGLLLLCLWAGLWSKLAERPCGPALLAIPAVLLALTRPEGVVVGLGLPVALLVFRRVHWKPLVVGTVVLLLLLGTHWVWRYNYYGSLVPNPYYAKVAFTPAAMARGASYLWGFIWNEAVVFLLPLVVYARRRDARYWTLCGVVLVYAVFVVIVGGDGLYRYRLTTHLLPCLVVAVAAGIDRVYRGRARAPRLATAGLIAACLIPHAKSEFFRSHSITEIRSWEHRWMLVGNALRHNLPSDLRLATNVAGRVPYTSRLPTLDLLGLTEPVIARAPTDLPGTGYAGHEQAAPTYVLEQEPDLIYFSVLDGLPQRAFINLDASRTVLAGGSLFRYVPMLEAPAFAENYAPAFVRMSDGRWANIYVRVSRDRPLPISPNLQIRSWSS